MAWTSYAPLMNIQPNHNFVSTIRRLLLATTVAISPLAAIGSAAAAERPNVLLVLLDDLGYSDLGCYGGELPTPNIDRLGQGGLRFTGMTTSARCCPSRAALLTGLYPGQAGIPNFGGSINSQCVTLAEVLGDSGYQTYAVGKWHVGGGPALPTNRGFGEYYGFAGGHSEDQWSPNKYQRLPQGRKPEIEFGQGKFYATDAFTAYALEFIQQAEKNKDKPWFLYLAHSAPHFPLQAPMRTVKPLLDVYRQGWDALREKRFERMKEIGLINHDGWKLTARSLVPVDQDNIANGYSGKPNPEWQSLSEDRREDLASRMAIYAAMVKHVDDGMGRIVEHLKKSGNYDNTLILILSDNGACYEWGPFGFDKASRAGITHLYQGEALQTMGGPGSYMAYGSGWANLGNTPFRLYKHFTHQGGIASPFIVHWPQGVKAPGRWVRDLAHLMDIMPTLAALAQATYPKTRNGKSILPMEGVSLTKVFQPGGALEPRSIGYSHEGARALHKGKWKLVQGKRFPAKAEWELYDMDADPCETNDLAPTNPQVVADLAKEWSAWAARAQALGK